MQGGNEATMDAKRKELDVDDEDDDCYLEPDEEELEEERQDTAAKLIQGLFRTKKARFIVRELIKANYVKEVDPLTGGYVYRNRRTGNVSRRKPVFLGSDDLETPRHFAPPDGYDPGKSKLPQFALVVTNRTFESPKVPDIPEQVDGDHTIIRETLEHPYFSKFESENCFFVRNASLEIFKSSLVAVAAQVSATMARLERESKRRVRALQKLREENRNLDNDGNTDDGDEDEKKEEEFDTEEALLFVYICTHAGEITKGKATAGTYLMMSDTSWKSKEALAHTALRLETLTTGIASVPIRHKVLVLDVVHTDKEHGGFKTRHLYPDRDLYDRAARLSGSIVIGSCRIGGTSSIDLHALRKEAEAVWDTDVEVANDSDSRDSTDSESESSRSYSEDDRTDNSNDSRTNRSGRLSGEEGEGNSGRSVDNASKSSDNDGARGRKPKRGAHERRRRDDREAWSKRQDRAYRRARSCSTSCGGEAQRGGSAEVDRLRRTSVRIKESPGRSAGETGGGSRQDYGEQRPFRGPSRKGLSVAQYEKTRVCAPTYDRAIYEDNTSVFGRLFREALNGACIVEGHHECVLVVDFYNFLRRAFEPFEGPREELRQVEPPASKMSRREAAKKERERKAKLGPKDVAEEARQAKEAAQKRAQEDEGRRRTMMPVLAGPSIFAIARGTVCTAPSPPPAPLAPVMVNVTRTSVRLAWKDPSYDGAPPFIYELQSLGNLRNNALWRPVFPPWYPNVRDMPVNVPHRVPGLGLRYRVRAFNHGGWGEYSAPSQVIMATPWLQNVGPDMSTGTMAALQRTGGERLVLARMKRYPSSLLVQERGFHQLLGEFNKGGGIPRVSLAEEVATVVADAMRSFSQVRSIQSSGLLLLGWAARGKGGGDTLPAELVERCLSLVSTAVKLHSMDVAVKNHAEWAKSNLGLIGGGDIAAYRATNGESGAETAPTT